MADDVKTGQVTVALETLSTQVDIAFKEFDALTEKVVSVLNLDSSSVGIGEIKEPEKCSLATKIDTVTKRVLSLTNNICDVSKRIEL